ncbi:MAG: hypothetical protein RJB39_17 [Candidatus Parcubacteria bacterium]|jgi:glycosyltransferase involved in cell wall biosynthesis
MKILHIITQGERGGAQAHVRDVIVGLQSKGHQTYVATGIQEGPQDAWLFGELKVHGFQGHQLRMIKNLSRSVSFWRDIKAGLETIKLVRSIRPEIVHLHSSKAGSVCAVAAKLAGAKVVYTVHGFVFTEPMSKLKRYFYILSEFISRFFRNFTITVSKFDFDVGRHMHIIPKKKGAVIYNGINEQNVDKILERNDAREVIYRKMGIALPQTVRMIGLVANLYSAKGVTHLIQAAYLARRYKGLDNTIFVVIGEGELRQELEQQIKELDLGTIFFLVGAIPDAYRYAKAFDLFVMPSVKEGFPYALLEMMLAKVPFIATRVGGIPEIEQYAAAPLVPPGSAKFLTEKIIDFLNAKKIRKMTLSKSSFPEKFTLRHMVDRIEEVYQKLL